MDVMFYEVFAEEEEALKRYLPKHIQAGFSKDTIQSDNAGDPPSRLISIRTQSIIPPPWMEKLSGILTRSSGFDHVLAVRKWDGGKITCGYLPSYCARSVAEHALLTILVLARRLKKQIRHFESFDRDGLTGAECFGRNLLVAGVGRIGKEIVSLAEGIGMYVKGVDLVKRVGTLEYVTLEEGVRFADIIVCALPLTKLTRGMFHYQCLRNARRGLIFVNISRGEISPIQDLKRLLDEGVLGGIGFDVYEDESILVGYLRTKRGDLTEGGKEILSLKENDNVLFTPHNAFNTREALERKAKQSSEAVVMFLKGGTFPDLVPDEEIMESGL